jgi:2'-deoxynucleoside 5'-phosphate N-hydrolase
MKIYFACSIRGVSGDKSVYRVIVEHLKMFGDVLTEHLVEPISPFTSSFSDVEEHAVKSDVEIFEEDMKWLEEADVIVAEISSPSHGVGYEIARAECTGKDIICLRCVHSGPVSAMIAGNPKVNIFEYEDAYDALRAVTNGFEAIGGFSKFVSPMKKQTPDEQRHHTYAQGNIS